MRARAPAGAAGDAELLTGPDVLAWMHPVAGQMRIESRVTPAHSDEHDLAVALVAADLADESHATRRRSSDRHRPEDPDVEPRMPAGHVGGRDRPPRRPDEMRRPVDRRSRMKSDLGCGRNCGDERQHGAEP